MSIPMGKYDEMYEAIHELKNRLDSTYQLTELTCEDVEKRVLYIYSLLEEYDEVRDENNN